MPLLPPTAELFSQSVLRAKGMGDAVEIARNPPSILNPFVSPVSATPAPSASVKVVEALKPDVSPVAVACRVAPTSSSLKTNQVVEIFPFSSATVVHGSYVACVGEICSTTISTVSPAVKPLPLITTTEYGG